MNPKHKIAQIIADVVMYPDEVTAQEYLAQEKQPLPGTLQ